MAAGKKADSPELDPRYTPKTVKQAVNHVAGAKKPPKKQRQTWDQRKAMMEKVRPLYEKPTGEVPPADPGSKWSEARDEHFLGFVSQGGILRVWLREAGLTYQDVDRRKSKDPEFAKRYEQARALGMDALAEEALEIASTPYYSKEVAETTLADGEKVVVRKSGDNVYARKLAVYARLDILKKWAPDKYGDKVSLDITDKRAAMILAARKRIAEAVKSKK